jgi:pyruvate kinase
LVYSSNKRIIPQLNLLWGVRAFYYDKFVSTDETLEDVNKMAVEKGYLEPEDMVISLAAMPLDNKGMVNTLRVTQIKN